MMKKLEEAGMLASVDEQKKKKNQPPLQLEKEQETRLNPRQRREG